MDPKALEDLEFHKVLEMLAKEADSPLGVERALSAFPASVQEARELQALGVEVAEALKKGPAPSIARARDVRPKVAAAGQGLTLTGPELRQVVEVLLACESLERFLEDAPAALVTLGRLRARLPRLPHVARALADAVDEDGSIKDGASPALSSIRRQLRDYLERMRRRAEEITRRKDIVQYLQEPIVTLRNGRYVLPVKQEHASKVPGLVHDQSASGQTLFIEPQELLEMANNLRRLELMERDEVDRILRELSAAVGAEASSIEAGVLALADFDLALAKARLLFKWRGSFPDLLNKPVLKLVRAWHPLLKGTPVPMDISLDEAGTRTVVITGPNMGGKTVALKTCGIIAAMALSGLPCPCGEETEVGSISDILCDMGDEQSIEEDLSTFSAHISNIVKILNEASSGKLILIDELGAGTDPQEGSALALAILKRLNSSRALSVVTTHFGELKLAAQKTPGIMNASVEWDAVNLRPTYRLVLGRPGRSNAFLVARKLGLSEDILNDARQAMDEQVLRLDDIIQDMEASSQKARAEAELAQRARWEAEALRSELQEKLRAAEATSKETLRSAKREAAEILARARAELERAAKEARMARGRPDHAESVRRIRESMRALALESEPQEDWAAPLPPEEAVPGTVVAVQGFGNPGVIADAPDADGNVLVRIGSMSVRTKVSELRRAVGQAQAKEATRLFFAKEVPYELDLRGMSKDEALSVLDKYLDDATLAALPQVRIIHGKGTGVLRKAISDYLRSDPRIREFRLGESGEGGDGVTIAKFT